MENSWRVMFDSNFDKRVENQIVINPLICIDGEFGEQFARLFSDLLKDKIGELVERECKHYLV